MYIPLEWNGVAWELHECPYLDTDDNREQCALWLGENREGLPRPKYMIGESVTFKWGKGRMIGDIRSVQASTYTSPNYVPELTYTIYANGHGRWVPEYMILGG